MKAQNFLEVLKLILIRYMLQKISAELINVFSLSSENLFRTMTDLVVSEGYAKVGRKSKIFYFIIY